MACLRIEPRARCLGRALRTAATSMLGARRFGRALRAAATSMLGGAALLTPACTASSAGGACDECGACDESIPPTSRNHVLGPIDYPDPPPTGGDHNPCWATWGVHEDVVPPERWVHNLEHGGIVFLYRSRAALPGTNLGDAEAADAGALSQLDTLVERLPRTLLTEYSALPKAFAVVSWGHRLVSDCVDLNAAERFYEVHFDHAPEDIASNPACD